MRYIIILSCMHLNIVYLKRATLSTRAGVSKGIAKSSSILRNDYVDTH